MNEIININYTKSEYIKWKIKSEYLYTGVLNKYIPLYIILLFLVILGGFVYKNYFSSIFSLTIMALFPIYMFFYIKFSIEKEFNKYYRFGLKIIIKDNGLDIIDFENNSTFVDSLDILKIVNSKDVIIIYLSSYLSILIPKRDVDSKAQELIINLKSNS